jgi:Fe-S cluster assembly protein SufD
MSTTTTHHAAGLIDDRNVAVQPSWLAERRTVALAEFGANGFPSRRDEEWRSTPIAAIIETPFSVAQSVEANTAAIDAVRIDGAYELVFVNGYYVPELSNIGSLPTGVVVSTLEQAIADNLAGLEGDLARQITGAGHAFAALNTASIGVGGAYIHVPASVAIETPIHLVFVTEPAHVSGAEAPVTHPRVLLIAGENSEVTLIERYFGPEGSVYLTNAVTEIVAGADSKVEHYKLQRESKAAFHMQSVSVELHKSASFISQSFGFGASIARNDIGAAMRGEYAEATLNGLFIAGGRQLMDSHTTIDHAVPNCPSHELYRHVLDGQSRGVFNGKIFVRLDAQKTDAKQTNKTLLLSPDAQISTKPQLEIFADDVRCTHGATVGQISDEQLFYLRSRGIGLAQAQELLVYAFAAANIARVHVEALRNELDQYLLAERHIEGLG